MTTQISFTADKVLKDEALEKARQDGITLKALLINAMKSYVAGEIALGLETTGWRSEAEEIVFDDKILNTKAAKLAKLLK